jgi:hypothetical protein
MAHLAFRMPANSDAASLRKAKNAIVGVRKAQPQAISPEIWKAIEAACVAGMGYSEAARRFGISVHAIIMRSRRNKWPVGSRIERRAEALQEARYKSRDRYKTYEQQRDCNARATEALAESWVERGEQHRALTFNLAHSELIAASKRGLPIEDWSSAEKADRMARKACGLDSEEGARISIGMALINDRLEVLAETLPKEVD